MNQIQKFDFLGNVRTEDGKIDTENRRWVGIVDGLEFISKGKLIIKELQN